MAAPSTTATSKLLPHLLSPTSNRFSLLEQFDARVVIRSDCVTQCTLAIPPTCYSYGQVLHKPRDYPVCSIACDQQYSILLLTCKRTMPVGMLPSLSTATIRHRSLLTAWTFSYRLALHVLSSCRMRLVYWKLAFGAKSIHPILLNLGGNCSY